VNGKDFDFVVAIKNRKVFTNEREAFFDDNVAFPVYA
jgi:hypothetical protein